MGNMQDQDYLLQGCMICDAYSVAQLLWHNTLVLSALLYPPINVPTHTQLLQQSWL